MPRNLGSTTNALDVATKGYVDALVATMAFATMFTNSARLTTPNATTQKSLFPSGIGAGRVIQPSFWYPGKKLTYRLKGLYSSGGVAGLLNTGGSTIGLLGSTPFVNLPVNSLLNAAVNMPWFAEIDLTCIATGQTGKVGVAGGLTFITGLTTQAYFDASSVNDVSIDLTTPVLLDATFAWASSNALQSVTTLSASIVAMN